MTPKECPCGRRDARHVVVPYIECCGRYLEHEGRCAAPDAPSLMRSRYSAFVLQRAEYLLTTWHPSARPATLEFEPGVKWLGLELRGHKVLDAEHAQVEFVARQRAASGRAQRLHECSRFVLEDGRWHYLDGILK
jgi:SEC-C motif-containing protein